MASPRALLLHAGGLRSLVAAAVLVREQDAGRVLPLWIQDGRADGATAGAAVELSCEAMGIKRVETLSLPHLRGEAEVDGRGEAWPVLWAAQALPAAMAVARRRQCDRVVWAANAGAGEGDAREALRIVERAELVMGLAGLEVGPGGAAGAMPRVETPLCELTDGQVVGLGERLGVDWRLARSCTSPVAGLGRPGCGACVGCERRAAAFAEAGAVDPLAVASRGARVAAA